MTSIARRLTLWMILGGGLLLTALFAVLDHLVDKQLHDRFDAALVERAQAFANLLAARDEVDRRLVISWPEFALTRHEDFYQIWNSAGEVLGRAASNRERDLSRPATASAPTPSLFDLLLPDGHRGRGVVLAVWPRHATADANLPWTVVVASEREALDALEQRIHRVLLYGIAGALLLMLGLSLAAVRAGLSPLRMFGEDAARRALAPRASTTALLLPSELVPIGLSLDRAFGALSEALVREQRFARSVAHELRTPIAEMHTVLERLTGGSADDVRRINALKLSLATVTGTVDGLMALARYEAGLETAAIEPFELCALLERLLHERAAAGAARGLHIERALPTELWVQSDATLLERVLSNLVGNAIDHAPYGARIVVSLQHADGRATFAIVNPAPALEPVDIEQFGERYFRPTGTTPDRRHVGLGLALSIAIAQQLDLRLDFKLSDGLLHVRLEGLNVI